MLQLFKRSIQAGLLGYGIYDYNTDEQLILRSSRTIKVGLQILYNYKWKFNEDNCNEIHEHIAQEMYRLCKDNDGLYVKFGQLVAASEHMVPPIFLQYFSKLQDQANAGNPDKIEQILQTELGENYKDKFQFFDPEPVAAASIAQVHKAILKDGSEVAVKIQKPNIQRQFGSDMFFHLAFCYMLDKAFDIPFSEFHDSVEENLKHEIDFRLEAQNAEQIRKDLKTMGREQSVYVPKIYHEFTNNRILVMEWVDAIKITEQEKLKQNNLNPESLIRTCIETFAEQIFITGFVHCDPHPGNLMARLVKNQSGKMEPQVVMLDFGLCLPLEEKFRVKNCEFWQALFLQDTPKLKEIATEWGVLDEETFASSILMRPYKKNKPLTQDITKEEVLQLQFKLKQDIKKMMSDMNKFPKELMFVGRNMNLVRSLNKRIGSVINRINIMAKYAVIGLGYQNTTRADNLNNFHSNNQNKEIKKVKKYKLGLSSADMNVILFSCRLFVSGCLYKLVQFWFKITRKQTFEEVLENQMKEMMEEQYRQYGMAIPDEKTLDA